MGINQLFMRKGSVFADRYHSRALKTPIEVRNALRYVINNQRHHLDETGGYVFDVDTWIDPYSSGYWFDGWSEPIAATEPWQRQMLALSPPTVSPRTWLLATGWRIHGLIGFHEVPGVTPSPPRRRPKMSPKP